MQCEGHEMDTHAVEDGLSESEGEEVYDKINSQTVAEDEVIVKASVEGHDNMVAEAEYSGSKC